MIQNKKEYDMVKERQSEDVVKITFTKIKQRCGSCKKLKHRKRITLCKYPILHKDMGRLIKEIKVCDDCYDDYIEITSNLKYN